MTKVGVTGIPVTSIPIDTDDEPKEECGVLGISTPHGDGVASVRRVAMGIDRSFTAGSTLRDHASCI